MNTRHQTPEPSPTAPPLTLKPKPRKHRRNGNIARLPKLERDLVNQMLSESRPLRGDMVVVSPSPPLEERAGERRPFDTAMPDSTAVAPWSLLTPRHRSGSPAAAFPSEGQSDLRASAGMGQFIPGSHDEAAIWTAYFFPLSWGTVTVTLPVELLPDESVDRIPMV